VEYYSRYDVTDWLFSCNDPKKHLAKRSTHVAKRKILSIISLLDIIDKEE